MKEKRKRQSRRWVDWSASTVMTVWTSIVIALIALDATGSDLVATVIAFGIGLVTFSVYAVIYKDTLS